MIDQNQKSSQDLTPEERRLLEQGVKQDQARSLQEGVPQGDKSVQPATPHFPGWPTSKPGPRKTMPPPGTRPINALRPEQVAEVGYNQETGEPSTAHPQRYVPGDDLKPLASFDQQDTPQITPKKPKERL